MKKVVPIVVLLLVALGGWLVYSHYASTQQSQAPPSAGNVPGSDTDKDQVAGLEKALDSADGQTQLGVLTPNVREAYKAADKSRVLPEGSTVKIKPDTFIVNGSFATVDAAVTSSSGVGGDFALLLTRPDTHSSWQLLDLKQK
jgi:hypothetical protein